MRVTIKHVTYLLMMLLVSVATLFSISCNQDKCKAINCAYGGTCREGSCECLPGYIGPQCEIVARNKFIGMYQVSEKGTVTPQRTYALAIEKDADVTGVLIKNLYNYFPTKIRATIDEDTLYIPNQQVDGKVVFGKGYMYSEKNASDVVTWHIALRYQVIDTASALKDDFGVNEILNGSKPSIWNKQ